MERHQLLLVHGSTHDAKRTGEAFVEELIRALGDGSLFRGHNDLDAPVVS